MAPRKYTMKPDDPRLTGKAGFRAHPEHINKGGFTSEQKAQHKENRDKAMMLEARMLAALTEEFDANEKAIIDHIRADVLRLIHAAIERHDGKAKQSVDVTSNGEHVAGEAESNAVLAALKAKHEPKPD